MATSCFCKIVTTEETVIKQCNLVGNAPFGLKEMEKWQKEKYESERMRKHPPYGSLGHAREYEKLRKVFNEKWETLYPSNLNAPLSKIRTLRTPQLDSSGNQIVKKTTLPVTKFVPVPAERRLPEPVLDKDLAKSSYDRSFGEALSKMYPGVERGEAEERLRKDHATAVSNKTREIVEQPSNIRSLAKKNIVISTINKARQMLTKNQEIPARLSSIEAAKAKLDVVKSQAPCTKCGKNCTDDVECKSNVMERRRQQAAEAAYND